MSRSMINLSYLCHISPRSNNPKQGFCQLMFKMGLIRPSAADSWAKRVMTIALLSSVGGLLGSGCPAMANDLPDLTTDLATDLATDRAASETTTSADSRALSGSTIAFNAGDLNPSQALDQVTSVSQLADVSPTDWAFQALQSLVERYGCIAGYPDGTFRGDRALTRYEFAAGLNACLDQVLTQTGGSGLDSEDLGVVKRLQEEFATELASLRGRVDSLETRTDTLEAQQFSTTTKLEGQVIFSMYGIAAGDRADGTNADQVTGFGHRTRLEFSSSFTGEDNLFIRLQSSNIPGFSGELGTNEGDLFYADDNGSAVEIDELNYSFPVGDQLRVVLVANAAASDDFAPTVNPFLDGDGNSGSLTRFGTRASIFYLMEQAGIGLTYELNDDFTLSAGYYAAEPADPSPGSGLFNGGFGAMGQVTFHPSDRFNVALSYLRSYGMDMGTGSNLANYNSFLEDRFGSTASVTSDAVGLEASWQFADWAALGGWVGYVNSHNQKAIGNLEAGGNIESWNWATTLAFPDLFGEGNLAGILVGQEPRVTDVSSELKRAGISADDDTSLHVEAFYSWQVTDGVTITPGLIWLTAPNHNNNNDDVLIGVVRTTFSF